MDEKLIESLEKFQFTKTESLCYITLLKLGPLTGYQIAKEIHLARSSVYSALENLYKKGAILLIPGESNVYQAVDYQTFISRIKKDYTQTVAHLEASLARLQHTKVLDKYFNIEGYDNILFKTKEMILTAKKEIFINSDLSPLIFEDEIRQVAESGVRIIFFSFCKMDVDTLPVEVYSHELCSDEPSGYSRIMVSIDQDQTLIASSNEGAHYQGIYTENPLLTSIVTEHIHHDIYLMKLSKKNLPIRYQEEIMIHTIFEKNNQLTKD